MSVRIIESKLNSENEAIDVPEQNEELEVDSEEQVDVPAEQTEPEVRSEETNDMQVQSNESEAVSKDNTQITHLRNHQIEAIENSSAIIDNLFEEEILPEVQVNDEQPHGIQQRFIDLNASVAEARIQSIQERAPIIDQPLENANLQNDILNIERESNRT